MPVRIAVIRLPRISNFTDFERLERYAAVHYVDPGSPLTGYDCIIIPGTKNTIEDLRFLQSTGMDASIILAREQGVPILGICGGYQMLGEEIVDEGVESCQGTYSGLGLLRVTTRFSRYEKITEQVERTARSAGPILSQMGTVKGYEIHMGETKRNGDDEAFIGEGAVSTDGMVIGTYLHGLFENPSAIRALLSFLSTRKGLVFEPDSQDEGRDVYEEIALQFERHVSMEPLLALFQD